MAITTAMCTSFKQQLLEAVHDFRLTGGDTFKIALYTSSATLNATTTAYSASNEVAGTGYSAGGGTLTRIDPTTSSTTAYTDFADQVWSTASITARGALIYNTSPTHTYTNPSCSSHDFGTDITSTAGDFTVVFPAADASNAIIRLA